MHTAATHLPLIALGLLLASCGDDSHPSRTSPQTPGSEAPAASSGQEPGSAQQSPHGIQTTPDTFSGHTAYGHCTKLCALGPRPSGSQAYAAQLDYLTEQLHAAGWHTHRNTFASPKPGLSFTNLHAYYPPPTQASSDLPPTDRPMLLTCHIDTKIGIPNFIGADDGASGAAVLLELARVLAAKYPQLATRIEIVFFDGEESFAPRMTARDGLYGSRHDLARRGTTLPRWMINLDMVGGHKKIIAVPEADTTRAMLMHYSVAVNALGLSPNHWTVYPGSVMDDHLPFSQAGVHTLNLIADFTQGDWWHTEHDNMSRISPDSLHETGRLVLRLLQQIIE